MSELRHCENCGYIMPSTDARLRCPCLDVYCDIVVCRTCRNSIARNVERERLNRRSVDFELRT